MTYVSEPEQIFLGSELTANERDPAKARFHVVPVPLEKTVSYGAGTARGPEALIAASHELERLWRGGEPCRAGIATQTPVDCDGPIEQVMTDLADRTAAVRQAGGIPVTLGGEHSLTWGAWSGVRRIDGDVGIVQIDAHADLRVAYQGHKHSHASVMHLCAEEGARIAQFGVRALCAQEAQSRIDHGVFYKDAEELVTGGVQSVVLPEDFPENIYVTFDVDGLDPSIMPATGTPVPGGLGYYQALSLVRGALAGRRCVGIDVVELAPLNERPAWDFTAAQIAYALMDMC